MARLRPAVGWLAVWSVPFAVVAAGELALSRFWPQTAGGIPPTRYEERAGLAYFHPNAGFDHRGREFSVRVETDALGYRAGAGDARLDAAAWVLGDSFAFGWGVSADETATALVRDRGFRVANLAIPGDGLPEYRLRLERLLGSGKTPAAVVVVVYDNDLTPAEARRAGPNELVTTIRAGRRAPAPFSLGWLLRLHTANLVGRGLRGLGLGRISDRLSGLDAYRRSVLLDEFAIHERAFTASRPFQVHLERLRTLAASARGRGIPIAVVRVASRRAASDVLVAAGLAEIGRTRDAYDFGRIDAALGAFLDGLGVAYASFPPRGDAPDGAYFPWDGHLRPLGQRRLGERLVEQLRGLGLRPEVGPGDPAPATPR